MAARNASVCVLTPNGRRQTVKVSPNTSLLQVLEEVCMKHGFNADDYGLRFQRNVLDLSLQWRFANLPNNAKLEVVSSSRCSAGTDSTVVIAVQLEDGSRLQHAFCSQQSLWELLSHFPELRISDEADAMPTCVYMRDEITGQQALRKTTLKSLGLTGGSAIIRYMLKQTKPTQDGNSNEPPAVPSGVTMAPSEHLANQRVLPLPPGGNAADVLADKTPSSPMSVGTCSITAPSEVLDVSATSCHVQSCKDETSTGSGSESQVLRNSIPEKEREAELDEQRKAKERMEKPGPSRECYSSSQDSAHSTFVPFSGGGQCLGSTGASATRSSTSSTVGPPQAKKHKSSCEIKQVERKSTVYHMDTGGHVDTDQDLPDEFFEVTVDDVRKRFAQLKSQRTLLEEAPLMTQALREAKMKEKMERYPLVVVRVQFPDRYVLQGFFTPVDTVTTLREFVKAHLEDPHLSFYLFIAPPKSILDDSKTLFQANLFPAAVVYFGSEVKADCFLRREVLESSVGAQQAEELIADCVSRFPGSSSSASFMSEDSSPLPAVPPAAPSQEEASELPSQAPKPVRTDPSKVPKWLKLPGT
ncbi:hypothetical protein ACEWY4_014534 [Coilia grayii]|uniref:UBX domain-containing protein n=1 Tax=Coilia grayii TaxID=363190 RepID=A0ABD1JSI7_9TELE